MSDRGHISADGDVVERCRDVKDANDETWTEFLEAALEARTDSGQDERRMNALTEDHIDDIGAEVERRVERVLETATGRR